MSNKIDMNRSRTYTVRIEADFEKINDVLADAVGSQIDAYEFGCGCKQDPPCIGCAPATPPAPEVQMEPMNCLSLFKVYTIDSDLCESEPIFVMARTEDGAACLFHKARARDHDNMVCEVIVSKVQDAEVCDE